MNRIEDRAIGTSTARLDGSGKVTGTAPYAYEHRVADPAYLVPATATIARGRVRKIDTTAARAVPGVLAVLTVFDAPRLTADAEGEYVVLQSPDVAYRGQMIAAVVAETPEVARQACDELTIEYEPQPHDTGFRRDHPAMYAPEKANGGYPADSERGNVDAAFGSADVVVDEWYSTPEEHNNPLEPHTVVALWENDELTLYDSTQHPHGVVEALAPVLGIDPSRIRVICPYIGGGFGSKGAPHAHDVLASMAARVIPGRAVKFAVTRQDMFGYVGYRAPTASHVCMAADRDGTLTGLIHEAYTQSSHVSEFVEQAAVSARSLYRVPNLRTTHRAVALDVPAPFWMRAPGEAPGMYAGEVAMDELAEACGIDPIELRIRNEPEVDPETGKPWSSRRLVECLREGGRRFGWDPDDRAPGLRRHGRWLTGTGVAVATYPHMVNPGSEASIRHEGDDRFVVRIGAADLGTGAWTALTLIAADALGCRADDVRVEIGDSALPNATVAGGSSGTSSWGTAIMTAAEEFRKRFGDRPEDGAEIAAAAGDNRELEHYRAQSYGAHFAEVRVDADTGEIRVPRMLGMFSVGRVINPRTARSQFIGGMCFGISMALFEESVRDSRFGHVVNHDLADYHVPTHADIGNIDAAWLDEDDLRATPTGSRGVGEIGIVGSAAAVVNALWHATGVRVRKLPAHLEDVSGALP
ncbi:xanthine dehydrogenase family protein molybdopterin-binding subunit [Rhodococcus artemisiae]|uniref:Xanthine dehydrogenase family protein molybdopterin-binding subunit n=1 Tax=Rhodococcus artemisiae TaxID=714159 RepID=A0ABU7L7X7_9NOCA|nr:xanthine dehydrogenase family protein molybdopterin-binding subunit [Rhodococcus artemisiae]MEE2057641.1 xanthine dehydrogenase family protein molybdopterin-binding subunit [Rhodococcus artemisiae]